MNTGYNDADTGAPLTPEQLERIRRDCDTRLNEVASKLTDLLRRASLLGMDRRAEVCPTDESKTVRDLTPLPEKVVYRFSRRVYGPRYQRVIILPPEVEFIELDDPRHPHHPDYKG